MLSKFATRPGILGAALLFLILPILAFPELIFGNRTLYWSDLSWMHYPRRIFAAGEWLSGRIPLWDPYQHNGMPLLAESQVGVLYPFSVLFLSPLSPSLELSLFILLHFTLAGWFTFILAKSLALSDISALVAGLSFGLGGVLMAQVANLNIMAGAVWLPLILFGVIKSTRQRRWTIALPAGIPLALQVFIAQPQVVLYSIVTLIGYGLYRVVADFLNPPEYAQNQRKWRPAAQTLLFVIVPIVSGLLLSAPQWLATLELQQLSVRSAQRTLDFLTENSLPPALLLNLVLPSIFGNNVTGFRAGDPFQEDFIYLGFIPLVLIFFSPAQRHKRDMLFFLLLTAAALLLALGSNTPLYKYIIQYLPGFSLFRIPARWLLVVNLGLAVLAGYGMETVLTQGISRRQWMVLAAGSLAVLLILGLSWLWRDPLSGWAGSNWSSLHQKLLAAHYEHSFTINPAYKSYSLPGWVRVPALLLVFNIVLSLGLFLLYALRKISAMGFGRLAIVLIALDLILAGGTTVNPTQPNSWWHQLSGGAAYVLENLNQGRVFPLGMGSEQAAVRHLGQYFPSVYQVRSAGGHGSSLMLNRTQTFLDESHPVQAVRALGVRYLLTEGYMGADAAATFPIVYADDDSIVYENPALIPRIYVVYKVIPVNSPEAALNYFRGTDIDPAITAVLETSQRALPTLDSLDAAADIQILLETPQTVKVAVTTAADGYLIMLDTFFQGWVATINGEPASIIRANYVSRAVFVPAGEHIVEFVYRPWSFWVGALLAVMAAVLLSAAAIYEYKYRHLTI